MATKPDSLVPESVEITLSPSEMGEFVEALKVRIAQNTREQKKYPLGSDPANYWEKKILVCRTLVSRFGG